MNPLRAAYAVTTASRYALGAVAGCAAPLWCRVRGHQLYTTQLRGAPWRFHQCTRCGNEWSERFESGRWV